MQKNMSTKRLLFFPQNETHLENMLPLLPNLENKGYQCEFIDASKIYHQDIYKDFTQLKLIPLKTTCEIPFYTTGTIQRIRFVLSLRKELKQVKSNYDGFFIGNDGALQRLVMKTISIQKTFFLVDAIINDNTFSFFKIFKHSNFMSYDIKDWIRRKSKLISMRIIRYLPFNYLLPSEIGTVRTTKMYVLGEYVKEVLKTRGIPSKEILACGLPRFRKILEYRHPGINLEPNGKFKIMTLTQSAVWHNDHVKEEVQKKQLFKLINLLEKMRVNENTDVDLNIRLHPRDIVEDRSYFFEKDFVHLIEGDLYKQLLEHDIVVATSSTVLLETLAINGRVAVMMLVDQWWRYERSFLKLPCFHKFHNEKDLENYFSHLMNGGEFNRAGLENLISPSLKNSVEIITEDVIKELS